MPVIRQLPPDVVNKIAAGEVIERPASIVKELVENAVDAGATRIEVALEAGGTALIRVVDNGCGLSADELPLAIASHATSKIQSADDLFCVSTLGFRGEALASIAAVSQMLIRSRPPAVGESGHQLEIAGGVAQPVAPCAAPTGTTLEVRNLFYNTPVRRKFLRTVQTEFGHATEAFTRIALAHPGVHFTLTHNGRSVHELPADENWRGRIEALCGAEVASSLIWVESSDNDHQLSGYVAHPDQSRSHNRMQYLFLNGRHIRDRSLQHALGEAYRGLLLTGRFPICFLRIGLPPDVVDVNVHPTKLEVRFADSGRIYSQLLGTLRTRFLTTDLTTRLAPDERSATVEAAVVDQAEAERVRSEFVRWAKGELEGAAGTDAARGEAAQRRFDLPYEPSPPRLELSPVDHPWATASRPRAVPGELPAGATSSPDAPAPWRPGGPAALQIHNRYLITENEDGVVVIDQHALHERILYEQLREKVLSGAMETQRLLAPETVHLSSGECAAALDNRDLLAQLGIEIEHFGGDTVLVSGYPAMLANFRPEEILRQAVDQLLSGGKAPDRRDLLDELLHMISCKAAIKAGDRLSAEEIHSLLELRDVYQDSHHCPHGRPTSLVFTREELDRRFKRI
ncbi:MAG: DNA mismatch repair endonuclease MutL [Planctomycetales bacterium]|nr:DNA mismatch repair endonuclease MutL [Planctomycetales bacterium]